MLCHFRGARSAPVDVKAAAYVVMYASDVREALDLGDAEKVARSSLLLAWHANLMKVHPLRRFATGRRAGTAARLAADYGSVEKRDAIHAEWCSRYQELAATKGIDKAAKTIAAETPHRRPSGGRYSWSTIRKAIIRTRQPTC